MQTLTEMKSMLAERGLAPRKSLGQNFLIDQNQVRRLVDRAAVGPGDLVLEVGPGTGVLTEALLERGCRVVAAELDRGLAELLRDRLSHHERFTLVEGDCLESTTRIAPALLAALADGPFSLVANLPYGCATPLMLTLMTRHPACERMAVTIQNEVIDRFLATERDGKAYGSIGVIAQTLMRVERIAVLPASCFWPRPGVTSGMVLLERVQTAPATGSPMLPEGMSPVRLADLVQRVFGNRRKQLGAVLRGIGITPEQAAEALGSDAALTDRIEAVPPAAVVRICGRLDAFVSQP